MEVSVAVGILTGGAVLLSALSHRQFEKVDIKEVLCRTGTRVLSPEEHSSLQSKISQAGLDIDPHWIQGLRVVLAGGIILITIPLLFISLNYLAFVLLSPLLYYFPIYWLNKRTKARQAQIKLALSEFTILLSTTLTAGANLQAGMRASANAISGPLKDEINNTMKAYGSGQPFSEALLDMARKVDVDELTSLVQTLVQIHDKGAPVAETMKAYSKQMRITKKFATMEQAGKLSVTMLFPIVIFMLLPFLAVVLYPAGYAISNAF